MNPAALALVMLLPSAAPPAPAACRFSEPREAVTLSAEGIERLRITSPKGSVRVEGRPGLREVRVRSTACANVRRFLEGIRLEAGRGDAADVVLEVHMKDEFWSGGGPATDMRLDLVVEVPEGVRLDLRADGGDVDVRGLAGARIQNGRGDVRVSDMLGDVTLNDLWGDIQVERVGGSVHVETDAWGDISAGGIQGDLRVDRDSSGDLLVSGVAGNFTLEQASRGKVSFQDVRGTVRIPDWVENSPRRGTD